MCCYQLKETLDLGANWPCGADFGVDGYWRSGNIRIQNFEGTPGLSFSDSDISVTEFAVVVLCQHQQFQESIHLSGQAIHHHNR